MMRAYRRWIKASLADIKNDSFIGIAGMPQPDGSIEAFSIHIFLPAQRGVVPDRHGPWDARPGSTMTNAYVESIVKAKDGETLTVKYKDGEKKIVVTPQTVIAAAAPGKTDELKAGRADHYFRLGKAAGRIGAGEDYVCRPRRDAGDVSFIARGGSARAPSRGRDIHVPASSGISRIRLTRRLRLLPVLRASRCSSIGRRTSSQRARPSISALLGELRQANK